MAYESLADRYREVENDINPSQGTTGGGSSTVPLDEQSPDIPQSIADLYKPFSKVAEKIIFGNPTTTDYSVSMVYKNFYGSGTSLTGPLATGTHSGQDIYDELSQEKIKKRKVEVSQLASLSKLGEGDLRIESLYDKSHKDNPNRQSKFIRIGMGNRGGLDIKGYSSDKIAYTGTLRGNEPYFVADIGSDDGPGNHTDRILDFYNSPQGRNTLLKENLLSFLFAPKKIDLQNLQMPSVGSLLGTGFDRLIGLSFRRGHHNLATNLAFQHVDALGTDIELGTIGGEVITLGQIGDIGNTLGSLRRPFAIEYSAKKSTGLPFGHLGDKPINWRPLSLIKPEKADNKVVRKALKKLRDKGLKETERIANIPVFKPSPFFDLSGGPGSHNETFKSNLFGPRKARGYDDRISDSEVEYYDIGPIPTPSPGSAMYGLGIEEDMAEIRPPLENIMPHGVNYGDFYVRFKDLRDNGFIYFRGYINGITENVSPSWTPTNYIGRSEPVYNYERAERDISFNLAVYPQSFRQQEAMYKKMERLTSMAYPLYMPDKNGLSRMKPPFAEMYMAHIGSKAVGQFGYIKTVSYTVNESGDWDALAAVPRVFNIALSYQILSKKPPSLKSNFYGYNHDDADTGVGHTR